MTKNNKNNNNNIISKNNNNNNNNDNIVIRKNKKNNKNNNNSSNWLQIEKILILQVIYWFVHDCNMRIRIPSYTSVHNMTNVEGIQQQQHQQQH